MEIKNGSILCLSTAPVMLLSTLPFPTPLLGIYCLEPTAAGLDAPAP